MRALAAAALCACLGCPGETATAEGGACAPGRQIACDCPGGGAGVQICNAAGTGYGACAGCPGGPSAPPDAGTEPIADAEAEVTAGEDAPPAPHDITRAGDGAFFEEVFRVSEVLGPDAAPSPHCAECGTGSLLGIVCAPNEQVFVPHALVTIDTIACDGSPVQLQTFSGPDGRYLMPDVPCGTHTVQVTSGSFHNSYPVTVVVGETTDITGVGKKQCFKAQSARIAVLWGQWDHMQDLLGQMGFTVDWYDFEWEFFNDVDPETIEAVKLLRDPTQLAAYDILFFNCGSAALDWVHAFPEIGANLRDFVLAGGSMYASDLSWAYIEAAFPDAIDFRGGTELPYNNGSCDDCPQQAAGHQDVPATIIDPVLASYAGVTTFTAKYGPGPLIMITAAGPGASVHVKGLVALDDDPGPFAEPIKEVGPLVISYRPGPAAGTAIYTTFHNDEQADQLILAVLYYLVFLL